MSSNRNKHSNSLLRRKDFFLGEKCSKVRAGRRYCDGYMHYQLVQYYDNGPVWEELCCLKCNKTHRVKMVRRGKARERTFQHKDLD